MNTPLASSSGGYVAGKKQTGRAEAGGVEPGKDAGRFADGTPAERDAVALPGGEIEDAVDARVDAGEEGRPVWERRRRLDRALSRVCALNHGAMQPREGIRAQLACEREVEAVKAEDEVFRAHELCTVQHARGAYNATCPFAFPLASLGGLLRSRGTATAEACRRVEGQRNALEPREN